MPATQTVILSKLAAQILALASSDGAMDNQ